MIERIHPNQSSRTLGWLTRAGSRLPRPASRRGDAHQTGAEHAIVHRGSGTDARIPIRRIRLRLNALAGGQQLLVSEMAESSSDRFNSALGLLLAALPGVTWDAESQRLIRS